MSHFVNQLRISGTFTQWNPFPRFRGGSAYWESTVLFFFLIPKLGLPLVKRETEHKYENCYFSFSAFTIMLHNLSNQRYVKALMSNDY